MPPSERPGDTTLPRHLKQYIIEQNYRQYAPIDHAVWRYVMRQAVTLGFTWTF